MQLLSMKEIQEGSLEILKKIDQICTKLDLNKTFPTFRTIEE